MKKGKEEISKDEERRKGKAREKNGEGREREKNGWRG